MTRRLILAVVLLCVSSATLRAQEAIELPIPQQYLAQPEMPSDAGAKKDGEPGTRFWVRADYLNWRITTAPISAPLVTGNANPHAIGALNEQGTVILFGSGSGQDVNFGNIPGFKITVGGWWEENNVFGWDANAFLLERRPFNFSASSAGGNTPIVSIPFSATQAFGTTKTPAGETALSSKPAPSSATVQMQSRLWGGEANYLADLWSGERGYWTAVVGFRYIDLNENLTLTNTTLDNARNGTVAVTDGFSTRSQYYAGQIGTRLGLSLGRFDLAAGGTVAFGIDHQVVNVAGATTVTNGAFGSTTRATTGGVFAQPSNTGSLSREIFTVVPEVNLRIGFAITPNIRALAGYNGMFLPDIPRPGNQIDRNINPTQNAFLNPPSGTLKGAAAPLPFIRGSDMWAHGLELGLEFRY